MNNWAKQGKKMLKLNQQSSFKADLKLAVEKVITIQSIPGVLYHSAKNLGFQGNADPQVWHSPEEAPEVSKVLGQVWSESTLSMLVRGRTRPASRRGDWKPVAWRQPTVERARCGDPGFSTLGSSTQGMEGLLGTKKLSISGQALADPSLQVTRFHNSEDSKDGHLG